VTPTSASKTWVSSVTPATTNIISIKP
jgi:hypothetical protein